MLDFAALPPEINSARMYSGPGSGPMLAAAVAWDALAAALSTAATGYASIISELTGYPWSGPASLAMATAAAPYLAWLRTSAGRAEHTAAQARAAAAAYELAFAATVPPPVIAANRTLLAALVATNFFGQNSPAIAVTEAHYAQMWLQDATAMYGYAAASASASRLAPFAQPPPTTDPAGLAAQSTLIGHASGAAATQSTTLSQLVATMPAVLQQLAPPTAAASPLSASTLLVAGLSTSKVVNAVISTTSSTVSGRGILIVNERLAAGEEPTAEVEHCVGGLAVTGAASHPVGTWVSVRIGRTALVGRLSVPAGWATAAPDIRPTALTLPPATETTAAAIAGDIPVSGSVFSQSVLGTLSREGADNTRHKSKPIIVRSPAAG